MLSSAGRLDDEVVEVLTAYGHCDGDFPVELRLVDGQVVDDAVEEMEKIVENPDYAKGKLLEFTRVVEVLFDGLLTRYNKCGVSI